MTVLTHLRGVKYVLVLSLARLFTTPWTVACQDRYLPNPGIEPVSLVSPTLAGRFFTTVPPVRPSSNSSFSAMCPQADCLIIQTCLPTCEMKLLIIQVILKSKLIKFWV